jgi:hypothetical protein
VFSGAERGGAIILVSRVNHRVELLDLATGSSRVLTLQSDRPRVALGFDDDVWIVAHDTTPDIGLTVIRNGQEVRGESFDDWFAALAPLDSSHALAASFNGALSVVDSDGTIGQVERTRLFSVSDVAVESPAAAWVVSENLGAAHRVELPSLEVQSRVYSQGLRFLERARSEGELLAIGARRVQLVQAPAGDQPTQ